MCVHVYTLLKKIKLFCTQYVTWNSYLESECTLLEGDAEYCVLTGRCFRQPAKQPRSFWTTGASAATQWSCQVSCRSSARASAAFADLWLCSSCLLPDSFCFSWPFLFPASVFHLCFLSRGAFEAARLEINRYQCSPAQWKCCLIKCCCLTAPIIAFETVLALYPWKDFMFTSCGSLQKMLLLTLWCHYIHSKYGAKNVLWSRDLIQMLL